MTATASTTQVLVRALSGDLEIARAVVDAGYTRDEALKALSDQINGGADVQWDGLWEGHPVDLVEGDASLKDEGNLVEAAVEYALEGHREALETGSASSEFSGIDLARAYLADDEDDTPRRGKVIWLALTKTERETVAERLDEAA